MMPDNLREALLTYCLDELAAGVSLAELLRRYPEQAAEIRPVLEMAVALSALPGEPAPAFAAQKKSRDQFLDQAQSLRREEETPRTQPAGWRRLILVFGLFLFASLGTLLFVSAAHVSLPGNVLHPVKNASESIALALAPEPLKPHVQEMIRHREIEEIIALMNLGWTADVQGEGYIEQIDGDTWMVYGIEMQITPETVIEGNPVVGATVQVKGTVRDHQYFARQITIIENVNPAADP